MVFPLVREFKIRIQKSVGRLKPKTSESRSKQRKQNKNSKNQDTRDRRQQTE
jgi:hypothetical protein